MSVVQIPGHIATVLYTVQYTTALTRNTVTLYPIDKLSTHKHFMTLLGMEFKVSKK